VFKLLRERSVSKWLAPVDQTCSGLSFRYTSTYTNAWLIERLCPAPPFHPLHPLSTPVPGRDLGAAATSALTPPVPFLHLGLD